jgi:hypothetical protein
MFRPPERSWRMPVRVTSSGWMVVLRGNCCRHLRPCFNHRPVGYGDNSTTFHLPDYRAGSCEVLTQCWFPLTIRDPDRDIRAASPRVETRRAGWFNQIYLPMPITANLLQ